MLDSNTKDGGFSGWREDGRPASFGHQLPLPAGADQHLHLHNSDHCQNFTKWSHCKHDYHTVFMQGAMPRMSEANLNAMFNSYPNYGAR